MMKSIFDHLEETLRKGYLVTAKFVVQSHGVMYIHHFDLLELGELSSGDCVNYIVRGGKSWAGALEPTIFDHSRIRDIEPHNRVTPETFFDCSFDSLDIIPVENGSRFLSLKKSKENYCHYNSSFIGSTSSRTKEIAGVVYRKLRLTAYLKTLLVQMGAPRADVGKIKKDIVGKIG